MKLLSRAAERSGPVVDRMVHAVEPMASRVVHAVEPVADRVAHAVEPIADRVMDVARPAASAAASFVADAVPAAAGRIGEVGGAAAGRIGDASSAVARRTSRFLATHPVLRHRLAIVGFVSGGFTVGYLVGRRAHRHDDEAGEFDQGRVWDTTKPTERTTDANLGEAVRHL